MEIKELKNQKLVELEDDGWGLIIESDSNFVGFGYINYEKTNFKRLKREKKYPWE